jgi:hypothetical protein
MWEINGKWISASPEQSYSEIIPKQMTPLRHHFESLLDLPSFGNGLYSRKAMTDYKKLLASGKNAKTIMSDMGEAVMDGSKPKFNIFKLLNLDAMVDFQAGVADRVFGIFANLDKHIFNLLVVYFFWSMGILSIRTIFEVVKIIRNDGFAPFKIITALFEPIVFLILFPFFADWKKEREGRTGDVKEVIPMRLQPSAPTQSKNEQALEEGSEESKRLYPYPLA